jgi:hypothetical protein
MAMPEAISTVRRPWPYQSTVSFCQTVLGSSSIF